MSKSQTNCLSIKGMLSITQQSLIHSSTIKGFSSNQSLDLQSFQCNFISNWQGEAILLLHCCSLLLGKFLNITSKQISFSLLFILMFHSEDSQSSFGQRKTSKYSLLHQWMMAFTIIQERENLLTLTYCTLFQTLEK